MNLPLILGAGGAALVGWSLLNGKKLVVGNSGPMTVKSVGNGQYLRPDAADAFNAMVQAAARDGVTLLAGSGFRSVPEQAALYLAYAKRLFAYPTVARPGKSNHGNGIAMDVAVAKGTSVSFGSSAFKWLERNALAYGFTWDEGRKVNEPWHWVYVG